MFHILFRDHIFQQNALRVSSVLTICIYNHGGGGGGNTHLGYGILGVKHFGIWDIGIPVSPPPPTQSCIDIIVPLVVLLHTSAGIK